MSNNRVLIDNSLVPLIGPLFQQAGYQVDGNNSYGKALGKAIKKCAYSALVVCGDTKITAKTHDLAAGHLKVIGVVDDAMHNLSVMEASQHGVVVKITEFGNTYQIANLARRMIVYMLSKGFQQHTGEGAHKIRRIRSIVPESYSGFELADMTVGLIGCGRVAQTLATELRPHCREVIGYDDDFPTVYRRFHASTPLELPLIEYCQFHEVLERSDIISIHTSGNLKVFKGEKLSSLRRRPYIVDTARDGVINEKLLVHALQKEQLRGVGITVDSGQLKKDSYPEPIQRLLGFDNVLLAPNLGKSVNTAHKRNARVLARSVISFLQDDDLSMAVNPEAVTGSLGYRRYPISRRNAHTPLRLRLNV